MRIAVLIIGLILTVGLFTQSLAGNALMSIAEDESGKEATSIGLFMALLFLVASAIVIPFPRPSMLIFFIAAVIGAAGWSDFPDLQFWSGAAVVLGIMSYFGHRSKKGADAKEAERDAMMQQVVAAANRPQLPPAMPTGVVAAVQCPTCGSMERPGARFCGSCGASLP